MPSTTGPPSLRAPLPRDVARGVRVDPFVTLARAADSLFLGGGERAQVPERGRVVA
jgi:hypothetical protein